MARTLNDYLKTPQANTPGVVAAREAFERSYALATQLIALREKHMLTQTELSEKTGVPQAQISRIERGVVNPRLSTVTKLLVALGAEIRIVETVT
jgi:DNA-binding XRE family transcriptional regulator